MANQNLSDEEKRKLTNARQAAVRNAWKNEKSLVLHGKGTRDWSKKEQEEMMKRGSVKGYDGHHMKSVSKYPQYAGEAKNIQFLNKDEHLAAHGGNIHNPTNGYYDPKTKTMYQFRGNELKPAPTRSLRQNDNQNSGSSDKNKNTNSKSQKSGKERSAAFRESQKNPRSRKSVSNSNGETLGKSNGNKR